MRTFPIFAVLFFVVPLVEIYLLIQVGSWIGVFPTILLVVLTAVLGAFLLRQQGLSTLARFQQSLGQGQLPAKALLEGVILLVGGALLMTPGFFTDFLGFACLLPPSRKVIVYYVLQHSARKVQVQFSSSINPFAGQSEYHQDNTAQTRKPRQNSHDGVTLEGDYTRKDDPQ
ncbi:MAG: hypothetical protein CR991_06860 [Proteobacteria bacterium]|nr:MAG: hypothetical protein CR991_06860 [Pseudomonadota bacterium]